MHLFFVNGPPRSGKDTVGAIIADLFGGRVDKFARILKERTHALYGQTDLEGCALPHDAFETAKDIPLPAFLGLTPRQAYIHVSETCMKPIHGDVIFATLLANDWESKFEFGGMPEGNFIITDSGFVGEAQEMMRRFPYADVTLLQIEREGTSFSGDSRSYINICDPNSTLEPRVVRTVRVVNNGTKEDLRETVDINLSRILGLHRLGRYILSVQVPGANKCGNPEWVEFGRATSDLNHALAQIETARRSHYAQRVVRLTDRFAWDGLDSGERYIYPGDIPVYDLVSIPV